MGVMYISCHCHTCQTAPITPYSGTLSYQHNLTFPFCNYISHTYQSSYPGRKTCPLVLLWCELDCIQPTHILKPNTLF